MTVINSPTLQQQQQQQH